MKQRSKIVALVVLCLVVFAQSKKTKITLPKRNVEVEVFKTPVKNDLDLTPITDFYAIEGNDLKVS